MLDAIQYLDVHNGAIMVVITLVYVIATIAICVANLQSAKATRDQLEESKRQYEEEHRAFISYEFIYENRTWYGLRFTNCGKRIATDVQIKLNEAFIESLVEQYFKDQLNKIAGKSFMLGINQSYDVYFGSNDFRARTDRVPIQGTIEYKDRNATYSEPIEIDFANYPPIFSVTTDDEQSQKAMKDIGKSVGAVASELKRINAKLPQSEDRAVDQQEMIPTKRQSIFSKHRLENIRRYFGFSTR